MQNFLFGQLWKVIGPAPLVQIPSVTTYKEFDLYMGK